MSCPRTKLMVVAVYGSTRVPVCTAHPLDPALTTRSVRSRRRMSLRVSQPLRPPSTLTSSVHAAPNKARLYPVFGARPLTARVLSVASTAFASGVVDTGAGPGNKVWPLDVGAADEVSATWVSVSSAGELHEISPAATTPIAATLAIDHRRALGADAGGKDITLTRTDTTKAFRETNEIA